jgi:hypothetical protein
MKTYTFESGLVLTEQEVISYFYGRYWRLSYMGLNFREDLFLLFSAFDKYGDLTNEN